MSSLPVLPGPVTDTEKHSYSWRSLPYLTTALVWSSASLTAAQVWFEARSNVAVPFALYTLIYVTYQVLSIPVNFTGRGFDIAVHQRLVAAWRPEAYQRVDIFLPICGEDIEILRNTWAGVAELIDAYPGDAQAFVLDDGPSDAARELAAASGFTYFRRDNTREHKKAGNLRYAFARTSGEYVVIFDADFRPRTDFLAETLPYFDDPATGIVQTPQFFRVARGQTWVERSACVALEVFYRAVQVCRDRFGSALCVGSNAVYRRSALEPLGGFTLIPYAEDSHTGLDARYHGYGLRYVPVVLAVGVCPATIDAFMRQQYRWCCGATSLIWTAHMWRVRMPLRSRLPYIAGWMWNLTTGVRVLALPLIPVVLLAFLPGEVEPHNAVLLIPAILCGVLLYPLWHSGRYPLGMWPLAVAVGWAQSLALWDYARGRVMSWEPTRGPEDATRRFRKAVLAWNGSLAVAWLALAAWRTWQSGSPRFGVLATFGVVNAVVVGRVIFPGRTVR